jgi:plasmid maintenance system killer protein
LATSYTGPEYTRRRICFEWPAGAAEPLNVEIVDYH